MTEQTATPDQEKEPRRARLAVKPVGGGFLGLGVDYKTKPHFVGLDASNGEPLLNGETHPNAWAAGRSKEAVVRAMVEVLEDLGFTVTPPAEDLQDPLADFVDPGAPDEKGTDE